MSIAAVLLLVVGGLFILFILILGSVLFTFMWLDGASNIIDKLQELRRGKK